MALTLSQKGIPGTPLDVLPSIVKVGESLSKALEFSPYALCVSDIKAPDQPIIFVNDRFLESTGYKREDIVGVNCRFLQGPETRDDVIQEMREKIDAGLEFRGRVLNYSKSGQQMWNDLVMSPVKTATGEVTHYTGIQVFTHVKEHEDAEISAILSQMLSMTDNWIKTDIHPLGACA
uniref:Putative LOV domain-containing protein n=1 Tax=Cymbomonas sp. BC-2016 TaxID=1799572 RepID=A0A126X3M2_9CHLO|nr:putative LOV domain-containing protein [Cymbomonas sp. BC-2016]